MSKIILDDGREFEFGKEYEFSVSGIDWRKAKLLGFGADKFFHIELSGSYRVVIFFEIRHIPKPVTKEVPRPLDEQIDLLDTHPYARHDDDVKGQWTKNLVYRLNEMGFIDMGSCGADKWSVAKFYDSTEWHKVTTKLVEVVQCSENRKVND